MSNRNLGFESIEDKDAIMTLSCISGFSSSPRPTDRDDQLLLLLVVVVVVMLLLSLSRLAVIAGR